MGLALPHGVRARGIAPVRGPSRRRFADLPFSSPLVGRCRTVGRFEASSWMGCPRQCYWRHVRRIRRHHTLYRCHCSLAHCDPPVRQTRHEHIKCHARVRRSRPGACEHSNEQLVA